MKYNIYKVELGIDIPQFNFKQKDKEFFEQWKYTIIGELITKRWPDLDPHFVGYDNTLICEFNLTSYPKFDIRGSMDFFGITKKDILKQMRNLRERLDKLPKCEEVPLYEN